eukprot:358826-Chlamydomonas_euryale.AAC.14
MPYIVSVLYALHVFAWFAWWHVQAFAAERCTASACAGIVWDPQSIEVEWIEEIMPPKHDCPADNSVEAWRWVGRDVSRLITARGAGRNCCESFAWTTVGATAIGQFGIPRVGCMDETEAPCVSSCF